METDLRGKLKPLAEKAVLKIARCAQRLTQGYSVYMEAPLNSLLSIAIVNTNGPLFVAFPQNK